MSFLDHLLPAWKRILQDDSVNSAILDSIDEEMKGLENKTINSKDQMVLNSASGEWLDRFGNIFGVYRKNNEKDDDYRKRIISIVLLKRATVPAIEAAIRAYLDDYTSNIEIKEPYKNIFTLNSSKLNSNDRLMGHYYTFAIINIKMSRPFPQELFEVLQDYKPAGVKIYISYYPNNEDAPVLEFPIETSIAKDTKRRLMIMNGVNYRVFGHMHLADKTNEKKPGDIFRTNKSHLNSLDRLSGSFSAWRGNARYNQAIYTKRDAEFGYDMGMVDILEVFRDKKDVNFENIFEDPPKKNNIVYSQGKSHLKKYDLKDGDRNILKGTLLKERPTMWGVDGYWITKGNPNSIRMEYAGKDNTLKEPKAFTTNSSYLNSHDIIGGGPSVWGIKFESATSIKKGKTYTIKFEAKTDSYIDSFNNIEIIETSQKIPQVETEYNGKWNTYKTTFIAEDDLDNFSIFIGFKPSEFFYIDGGDFSSKDNSIEQEWDGGSFDDDLELQNFDLDVDGGDFRKDIELSEIRMVSGEDGMWKPAPEDGVEWYHSQGEAYAPLLDVSYFDTYMKSNFDISKTLPEDTSIEVQYRFGEGTWETVENGDSLDVLIGEEFGNENIQVKTIMKTNNQYKTPYLNEVSLNTQGKHYVGEDLSDDFYERTDDLETKPARRMMDGNDTEYLYFILDGSQYLMNNYRDALNYIANGGTFSREDYLTLMDNSSLLFSQSNTTEDPNKVTPEPQLFNVFTNEWDTIMNRDEKSREDVTKADIDNIDNYVTDLGIIPVRMRFRSPKSNEKYKYEMELNYFEFSFRNEMGVEDTVDPYLRKVSNDRIVKHFAYVHPQRSIYRYHYINSERKFNNKTPFLKMKYYMLTPRRALYIGGEFGDNYHHIVSGGDSQRIPGGEDAYILDGGDFGDKPELTIKGGGW